MKLHHYIPVLLISFLLLSCGKQNIRELYVQTEDVALYTRIAGNPNAVHILIALHGGPGMSSDYMYGLERLTYDNCMVVTYDQRGTGKSGKPDLGYGFQNYISDLEAVRKAVTAEQVHVLGHSWGGIVALYYASVFPGNLRSLILAGSGPPDAESSSAGQARVRKRIAELQQAGIIPLELPGSGQQRLQAILPAYFSNPGFTIPGALRNMSSDPAISGQTMAAIGNWDFTDSVGKINLPVLLLWGENDPFGLHMAEATKNALSSAQVDFYLLKDCGHFWHECESVFFLRVRSFLDTFTTM